MLLHSKLCSLKSRPPPVRNTSSTCLEPLETRRLMSGYFQTNLASDIPGIAQVHDPELVDAQGIAINPNPGGTFWLSARATDVSTVYIGDVTPPGGTFAPFVKRSLTVNIPGGSPTGQVFNGSPNFVVTSGPFSAPAVFIFASEDGHITGWNPTVPRPPVPSTQAHLKATTPGAVYTGLAIDSKSTGQFIYAADFENGKIDVFDKTYTPTTLAGSFEDPNVPAAYSPINIQSLDGKLYVAYARQDRDGDGLPGNGAGFVSVFDTNGNFLNRVVSGNHLHAPWGMAMAPANFGEFSGDLLVANTATGRINAFDPGTGKHQGQLRDPSGKPVKIDGLWGLDFGNGVSSGDSNALYFSAGPDDHRHGLFGSLRVVPVEAVSGVGSALAARDALPKKSGIADDVLDTEADSGLS